MSKWADDLAVRRSLRARTLGWCGAICQDALTPGVVCHLEPGHADEHRDRVLSIEWSDPVSEAVSAPLSMN